MIATFECDKKFAPGKVHESLASNTVSTIDNVLTRYSHIRQ